MKIVTSFWNSIKIIKYKLVQNIPSNKYSIIKTTNIDKLINIVTRYYEIYRASSI